MSYVRLRQLWALITRENASLARSIKKKKLCYLRGSAVGGKADKIALQVSAVRLLARLKLTCATHCPLRMCAPRGVAPPHVKLI